MLAGVEVHDNPYVEPEQVLGASSAEKQPGLPPFQAYAP